MKKIYLISWTEQTHASYVVAKSEADALGKCEKAQDFDYKKQDSGLSGDRIFKRPGDVRPEILGTVDEESILEEIREKFPEETKEV